MAIFGILTEGQITPTYGWFSPSELEIVVVGGQSLVGWAELFSVKVPEVETEYLTQDLDLLCSREDGIWLAEYLGTTFYAATMDDATCQTAKLTYRSKLNNGILVIDCLDSIIGPDTELVRKLSVPVKFAQGQVNLLHPLLCLHSRLANLCHIPSKRDGNGIAQAEVAVAVVEAYLLDLLTRTHPGGPEIRAAVNRTIAMANSREGYFCYQRWGVDPLLAVAPSLFSGWLHHLGRRRLYLTLRRILHKREVFAAADDKRVHVARSKRSADYKVTSGILELLRRWNYVNMPWPGRVTYEHSEQGPAGTPLTGSPQAAGKAQVSPEN